MKRIDWTAGLVLGLFVIGIFEVVAGMMRHQPGFDRSDRGTLTLLLGYAGLVEWRRIHKDRQ